VVDIDADPIGLFPADVESMRGNSARSRSTRLFGCGNALVLQVCGCEEPIRWPVSKSR
jgi:hypothetical protein